jgi:hypothetical protein
VQPGVAGGTKRCREVGTAHADLRAAETDPTVPSGRCPAANATVSAAPPGPSAASASKIQPSSTPCSPVPKWGKLGTERTVPLDEATLTALDEWI